MPVGILVPAHQQGQTGRGGADRRRNRL